MNHKQIYVVCVDQDVGRYMAYDLLGNHGWGDLSVEEAVCDLLVSAHYIDIEMVQRPDPNALAKKAQEEI